MRVAVTFGSLKKLEPYEAALRLAGLEPVRNPEELEGLRGLLLTGGTDIDPVLYGQTPEPETDTPDRDRDNREIRLLQQALALDLPVLGICRGLQMFNVALGGTLIQHLPAAHLHSVRTGPAGLDVHTVTVLPDTQLARILGAGEHQANSRHHQAVQQVAPGLRISARSEEVIEGLEHPDKRFAVAVQWHPEDRLNCAGDRRLFEAFAAAVSGRW